MAGETARRQSWGSEIADRLRELAARATSIQAEAEARLAPVTSQPAPTMPRLRDDCRVDWPPLLSELRSTADVLEIALEGLEGVLSRVEV